MTSSEPAVWFFLGRVDIVFGVLGGLVMVWGMVAQIRRRLTKTRASASKHSSSPVTSSKVMQGEDSVSKLIVGSVDKARDPIGCSMIGTAILAGIALMAGTAEGAGVPVALSIVALALSAVFLGLVVGVIVDALAQTTGTPVAWAVLVAVPFAGLTVIGLSAAGDTIGNTLWVGPTVLPSLAGAVIGSIIGLVREKEAKSQELHPDGTWERAEEIAIKTLKEKLDKYGWFREKTNIESLERDKGTTTLVVAIVEEKSSGGLDDSQWWPIERYRLRIDRTGDILTMRSIPLKEDEKYKSPSASFFGGLDQS
jgi:hypothetical protein